MHFTIILSTAILMASYASADCVSSAGSIIYTRNGERKSAEARFFANEHSGPEENLECDYRGSPGIKWTGHNNAAFYGECSGGRGSVEIRMSDSPEKIITSYQAFKGDIVTVFENEVTSDRIIDKGPGSWERIIQFSGRSRGCR